jgi:hypothetical protein
VVHYAVECGLGKEGGVDLQRMEGEGGGKVKEGKWSVEVRETSEGREKVQSWGATVGGEAVAVGKEEMRRKKGGK